MEALKRSVEEAQAAGRTGAGSTSVSPSASKNGLKQAPSAKPVRAAPKKKKVV